MSSSVEREVNEALLAEVDADATVFVEAERIGDARALYDRGATYVIVTSHLAAERLSEYLELYATDRPAFEDAIARDIDDIRARRRRATRRLEDGDVGSRSGGDIDVDPLEDRRLGGEDDD